MAGEKAGGTAIIFQKFPECQIEASSWSRWFFQTTSELSKFSLLSLLLVSETESRVSSLWVKTNGKLRNPCMVPLKSSSNRQSCIYSLVDISVTFPGQMPLWWFHRLSVHLSALPHDFVNPPWRSVEAPMITISRGYGVLEGGLQVVFCFWKHSTDWGKLKVCSWLKTTHHHYQHRHHHHHLFILFKIHRETLWKAFHSGRQPTQGKEKGGDWNGVGMDGDHGGRKCRVGKVLTGKKEWPWFKQNLRSPREQQGGWLQGGCYLLY